MRSPDAEQPPTAVVRRAEDRVVRGRQQRGRVVQVSRLQLRGVHADLHDRGTARLGHIGVGVQEALGEVGTALAVDGPSERGCGELAGASTGGQITGQSEVTPLGPDRLDADLQGVEQRRRGQVGRLLGPDDRTQPGLGLSGHRRLGDHQHDRRSHERTRAKSRAARRVPMTEPETLDFVPSARGW